MNSLRLPAWFARANLVCMLSTIILVDALIAAPQSQNASTTISNAASAATRPIKLPKLIATGEKSFEIPFSINASQSNVVEVVLQMSTDRGKSWKEHSRRSPVSNAFPFSSPDDKEFWFAIQTIDRNGQSQPPAQALKPELRIAVDTQQPQLEFEVRPDATGRIVGVWTARDENIDPCSMIIQYQSESSGGENWYTVPAQTCQNKVGGTYRDQLAWWPQTTARNLKIRATIKDLAGNEAVVERTMLVPLTAQGFRTTPGGNHLRGTSAPTPQATAQTATPAGRQAQLPKGRTAAAATTNYLRSRLPYALSDQYGTEVPAAGLQNDSAPSSKRNQLRDQQQPDQSSVARPTAPQQNASYRQAAMTGEPTPQPPRARNNRFASNQSGAAVQPTASPTLPATQWRSRTTNRSGSQVSNNSTESWQQGSASPVADPTQTRVARKQEFYNSNSGNPPQRLAPQSAFQQAPASGSQSNNSGKTSLNRSPDPMSPQAPIIPDQSSFRNDATSANGQWISSTTGISQRPAPTPSSALATGPEMESLRRSARPSNSKRFQLEYDIDAVGPEGVKTVELWTTRDGGSSWRRLTTDEDLRSPVNVAVDSEGIFGFRILVISNEGLRARQPRSGDPADMWVNVDTTKPSAQITAVPYGRGQTAGKLLVQWQATDANLRLRPVKLSYSPGPQGPWTTIEDGIRNESQYAWKPGVDIPDKVYLQLEVSDVAGNVAIHQVSRPVDVSGLIPRGHIRGITPLREVPTNIPRDTDT